MQTLDYLFSTLQQNLIQFILGFEQSKIPMKILIIQIETYELSTITDFRCQKTHKIPIFSTLKNFVITQIIELVKILHQN